MFKDCNCDGKIDCKDRLAIHLKLGKECINPNYGNVHAKRFNDCAEGIGAERMNTEEEHCETQVRSV